jgi:hypothetical protein
MAEQIYLDLEFPLTNLDVINFGNCGLCKFCINVANQSDIKPFQNHYQTNHIVIDVVCSDIQDRHFEQDCNSLDPSK